MENQNVMELKVDSNGCVNQVRTITTGDEWKKETRIFNEKTFTPDMDVSSESDEVQSLCNETWTDEVKAAWAAKVEELENA